MIAPHTLKDGPHSERSDFQHVPVLTDSGWVGERLDPHTIPSEETPNVGKPMLLLGKQQVS